jgi:glycerol-3-phosphate dehydrogenase
MPLTAAVVAVCHQGRTAKDVVDALMQRDRKAELYGLGE